MTKKQISTFLIVYLLVVWTAVVLRIDRFPLTWAPMYSIWSAVDHPEILRHVVDKKHLKEKGFRAIHRDGTTSYVSQRDLNIRTSSMRRLYYRRMVGRGTPSYRHINHDAGTLDRWLFGLEPGARFYLVDWHQRLFRSINRTLGHAPEDAKFIVRLEAEHETLIFRRETLEFLREEDGVVTATWDESWAETF
ncbi:MAG: hypothetical protein VCC67_06545 [Myxococcota bacterium]